MNDPISAAPEPAQATPPDSAGAILRAARLAQKLSIEQLAERLKVSPRKLEALEAERHDILSDPVFTRALAASVCRTLLIDAEPVLARLPQPRPTLISVDDAGLNTTFHEPYHGLGRASFWHDRTTIGIAVLVLLAAALAIVIWPRRASDASGASSPAAAQQGASAPPAAATVSGALTAPASVSAPTPKAEPAAPAPVQKAAPLDAAPLTLKASGTSWVQVTDAKGVVQLHKTMQAGEEASVGGDLPLTVAIGRADLISVTVRSQPFDLSAVSKSNVARFEVK